MMSRTSKSAMSTGSKKGKKSDKKAEKQKVKETTGEDDPGRQ